MTDKVKPVASIKSAHETGWVSALGTNFNTDMLVSGAADDQLNFYRVDPAAKHIEKKFSVHCVGLLLHRKE